MSDLLYRKYGATVTDPSAGMQAGINAQKANLSEVLKGVEGLMKNQEAQYVQQNTTNVQNYFKEKLQSGGLNSALTEPVDQDIIKQKFGNMIDLGAVNNTVTAQTDLLKKDALETASSLADEELTRTRDPLQATSTFKNTLLAKGATHTFADAELPGYVARKATEVQNIATAKLQEHDARVNHMLDAAAKGGHDAGKMAIEASIFNLPESEKAAARMKMSIELEKAGELTQFQSTQMKDYVDSHRVEATRQVNDAKNKAILLQQQLAAAASGGIQDKYLKAVEATGGLIDKTGKLGSSVQVTLGDIVNNFAEKWGGASSESGQLRQIHKDMIEYGMSGAEADAILLQSFQDAYDGGGAFGNDLNKGGLDSIRATASRLMDNVIQKRALQKAVTEAEVNVSNVTAKTEQDAIGLRHSLMNAGRDEQLSRGAKVVDPKTPQSIDKAYAEFKKKLGFDPAKANVTAIDPTDKTKPEAAKKNTAADLKVQVTARLATNEKLASAAPAATPATTPLPPADQSGQRFALPTNNAKTEIRNKIKPAVQEAVLKVPEANTKYLMVSAALENPDGNPNAVNGKSSAKGMWQFVSGTSKAYGLEGKEGNVKESAVAAAKLYRDNKRELGNVPDSDLYIAHQQGAAGYKQIVKAARQGAGLDSLSPDIKRNILNNVPEDMRASVTPTSFIQFWRKRYTDTENNFYKKGTSLKAGAKKSSGVSSRY